jgi:hypothetical protein
MWNLTIFSSIGDEDATNSNSEGAKIVTELKLLWSARILLITEFNPIANNTILWELSKWIILVHSTMILGSLASETKLEIASQIGAWIGYHPRETSLDLSDESGARTPWVAMSFKNHVRLWYQYMIDLKQSFFLINPSYSKLGPVCFCAF